MIITKYSGSIVDFDEDKLRRSLLKSGAVSSVVDDVIKTIEKEIYNGISTEKIYKLAFGLLKKIATSHASRYNLRSAIQLLGPTGFLFEKYIARIFAAENYETKINLSLQGKCVSHEIDIAFKKNNRIGMIECKFHNSRDANSDVKVPLYILSRFNDLKDIKHPLFSAKDSITDCWIVTNNRFTSDATTFANCSGLNLLSWDYPAKKNLKTKIDENHLYPITCLTTLSMAEKEKLLLLNYILVKELLNNSDDLIKIGLNSSRIKNVLKEVADL